MGGTPSKEPGGPYGLFDDETEADVANKVSPIFRNADMKTIPEATKAGATTAWECVEPAFAKFGASPAAGQRQLVRREWVEEHGKKFEKLHLAPKFDWVSYKDLGAKVEALAAGLVSTTGLAKGSRVLIYAETQRDWMVTAFACWRQGAEVVTAYATLGEEGVATALNQTKAAVCVCDAKLFKTLAKAAASCPGLKHVVTMGDDEVDAASLSGVITTPMTALVALGSEPSNAVGATPAGPKDVAVVMYTSGTTGKSKGVLITHEAIAVQCAGGEIAMPFINDSTTFCAYLPLAHIMELFIEVFLYSVGAKVGYGSPHTLTDTGVKLAAGGRGDAPLLEPTLLVFAPAVLDKVYAAVRRKLATGIKKAMLESALAEGYRRYDAGKAGAGAFWDTLLMGKLQALVGGKVTYMVTGSAPLSADIQKFCQAVFNCPVRQGYGLTETCAASVIGAPDDNTTGVCGAPQPSTWLRLRDWDEGGYTNADKDKEAIGVRRGEVLLGGPTVAAGYLVDPDAPDADVIAKNAEDFVTIDGVRYFCTGDVGQVLPNGQLQIVDRKKDLFKGGNGEYVALSKVESLLKLSEYVEIPMVYGRTGADKVIAVICPQKPAVLALGAKLGLGDDFVKLCTEPAVIAEVSKSCLQCCKQGGLAGFEIPGAVALVVADDGTPAWTPDNGLLTDTMKLKRPIIAKACAEAIDDCYARASAPAKV